MIILDKTEVFGWEAAIRGMRNPMNSWDRSDSKTCDDFETCKECLNCSDNVCLFYDREYGSQMPLVIGQNDHDLMMQLTDGGPVHAKYRRMITVYVDITAPLYWWKEFDTYKVGTVANSCSTMHKIADKDFTLDDFSYEHLDTWAITAIENIIDKLNRYRKLYLEYDPNYGKALFGTEGFPAKKDYWWQMIQLLPSSYNQKRTVMMNYEVLAGIYKHRRNHKLDEWRVFCGWIKELPYSEIITGEKEDNKNA